MASLHRHACNHGKRSVVLDLDDPAARDNFMALVANADLVSEIAGPGVMDARGLGFDALSKRGPTGDALKSTSSSVDSASASKTQ